MTEYISGGELFDEIEKCKKLSEETAADTLRQILNAVTYCHNKQIMHRDLKPENILIDSITANKYSVKVIDFGSAHSFFNNEEFQAATGTAYYMAPEVLMNNYNELCDVWSSGVILYIMISGKPPFTGESQEDIMRTIKKASIKFPQDEWNGTSEEVKDLIKKMIKYPPRLRISAHDAYEHMWMKKYTVSPPPLLKETLEKIKTRIDVL